MNPTNPYAASKAAAECIVLSYWECFGVSGIEFKLPVITMLSGTSIPRKS